jgi:hypothetical protein
VIVRSKKGGKLEKLCRRVDLILRTFSCLELT